jgi:hypothetical protein
VVLVVAGVLWSSGSDAGLTARVLPITASAEQSTDGLQSLLNRSSCAEVGASDLQLPSEGLWFQSNCLAPSQPALVAPMATTCNRTSLDPAEFTGVSPDLYVYRQARASTAYLWYASSEACFDLVSTRSVTAVCADYFVSFQWNARLACSGHGGVLALVNGH